MTIRTIAFLFLVVICPLTFGGSFVNGGFEDGSFNGWTQGAGWWYGGWPLHPTDYLPGGVKYDASAWAGGIVTPGDDPIVGNNLNRVYGGSYSARINDWYNNYSVSVISQTVLGYTDPHVYFAWAAVLESSHGSTDSDNFTLQVTDLTTSTDVYSVSYNSYDNGNIFHPYNNWFYTDWQVVDLDTNKLGMMGHDIQLTLLGSDCPYGGHAGYVYLDGFGATPPTPGVPEPSAVVLVTAGIGLIAFRRYRR